MTLPDNGETWLICGSRRFADRRLFETAMTDLVAERDFPKLVIHGAARGADLMGDEWARRMGISVRPYPAEWSDLTKPDAVIRTWPSGRQYDAYAGPRRNQKMVDEAKPDLVIAFPHVGNSGTADMVRRAKAAGIVVIGITLDGQKYL